MRIREHMVTHGREIQLPEGETTKGLMEETGEIVRECAPETQGAQFHTPPDANEGPCYLLMDEDARPIEVDGFLWRATSLAMKGWRVERSPAQEEDGAWGAVADAAIPAEIKAEVSKIQERAEAFLKEYGSGNTSAGAETPEVPCASWPVELDGGTFAGLRVNSPVESGTFWVYAGDEDDHYEVSIQEPEADVFAEQYARNPDDPDYAPFVGPVDDDETEAS